MKDVKAQIVMTGIICLTIIEAIALFNGINGVLMGAVIAAISAAIGVIIPTPKVLKS